MTAVTSNNWDMQKLQNAADRINTLERMFNLREGFNVSDDILPKRLMKDPLIDGPAKGQVVTEEQLEQMRSEYFSEMGWDRDGIPTLETIHRLAIELS